MFKDGIEAATAAGVAKYERIKQRFGSYIILSLLAGFYIGAAMFISIVIGARTPEAPDRFLMGLGFSVGLLFVVFAGAELFTGNVLTLAIAGLSRKVGISGVVYIWVICFLGNICGGFITALLARYSGLIGDGVLEYLMKAAATKTSLGVGAAFIRAILCNIFVTLGIWMAYRAKSEGAKIALIIAAVFAFVVSGYEHVVANAFLLPAAWLASSSGEALHGAGGLAAYIANMGVVGLGNLVGGLLVAIAYYASARE